MKIKRAYKIPDRITMGIFRLPCIIGIRKIEDEPVYELADNVHDIDGEEVYHVPFRLLFGLTILSSLFYPSAYRYTGNMITKDKNRPFMLKSDYIFCY